MGRPSKAATEQQKADPLVEAQKAYDAAKLKSDAVNGSEDFSAEEREAVRVELEDAEKMLAAVKELGLDAPAKPSSESRKLYTLSCLWAQGRYPKLGLKFTNGIAVVTPEQHDLAKASTLWNREIFDGPGSANAGGSVKVTQS